MSIKIIYNNTIQKYKIGFMDLRVGSLHINMKFEFLYYRGNKNTPYANKSKREVKIFYFVRNDMQVITTISESAKFLKE